MSWNLANILKRYISSNARTSTASGKIYESVAYGTGRPKDYIVISSATADTFGSYVEIEDSLLADSIFVGFSWRGVAANDENSVVEFATGAGGAEVPFLRMSFPNSTGTDIPTKTIMLPIGIKIAAGTRIACRIADSEAAANQHQVCAYWYQGLETI